VHHLASSSGEVAARLVRATADAEDQVEFRTVPATPGKPLVRYFLPEDKAAAERLAEKLKERLGSNWKVQDLTHYRPRPSQGTLEVWLPRRFSAGGSTG